MSTRPLECGYCGFDHPSSEDCPVTVRVGGTVLEIGDRVWWNDPDEGSCSDWARVTEIREDMVRLESERGSEIEALAEELSRTKGDDEAGE